MGAHLRRSVSRVLTVVLWFTLVVGLAVAATLTARMDDLDAEHRDAATRYVTRQEITAQLDSIFSEIRALRADVRDLQR